MIPNTPASKSSVNVSRVSEWNSSIHVKDSLKAAKAAKAGGLLVSFTFYTLQVWKAFFLLIKETIVKSCILSSLASFCLIWTFDDLKHINVTDMQKTKTHRYLGGGRSSVLWAQPFISFFPRTTITGFLPTTVRSFIVKSSDTQKT